MLLTLAMLGVLWRVGSLQYQPIAQIVPLTNSQRSKTALYGRRGNLLDRTGRIIATTRVARRLFIDPLLIQDPNTFSEQVGYSLNYDPAAIERKFTDRLHSRYVVIDEQISDERTDLVRMLKLPGLTTEPYLVRQYPQGQLAGHVIGFVGRDGDGLEGLELTLNRQLPGTGGSLRYWRDAKRRPLWVHHTGYRPPTDGQAVRLSLDMTIQSFAEKALDDTCEKFAAPSAQMVVMNPVTGEILAMANYPAFNPARRGNDPPPVRRNRCVTDAFEPGSTFKAFIWTAATDGGFAQPGEMIDCHKGLYVTTKGRRLRDAHAFDLLDWEHVLIKSSNIGMAIIGQRMGNAQLHRAVRMFGFGAITASRLPGEVAGIVHKLSKWTHYSESSIPMGQEVAITPLQLARAFCIIANGGRMISPTMLPVDPKQMRDTLIYERIISPDAAEQTKQVLRRVVTEGTGRKANSDQFAIFGKTGTAQIADRVKGGYAEDKYTSVFVCGAPVDDPQLVIAVVVHEPDKKKGYYGGTVAAPAAKNVIEQSLTYLGVAPMLNYDSPLLVRR
jgi:cell division protein FtsI/penicillin-binding protein 2